MDKPNTAQTNYPPALLIAAREDRFGEHRGLGISSKSLKVTPQDSHDSEKRNPSFAKDQKLTRYPYQIQNCGKPTVRNYWVRL